MNTILLGVISGVRSMHDHKALIFGALPSGRCGANPGGIVSATLGLREYGKRVGCELDVIDLYSNSFPPPSFPVKVIRAFSRFLALRRKLKYKDYEVAFLFCSHGFGFFERMLSVFLLRMYRVPSIVYFVSGHFFDEVHNSRFFSFLARFAIRMPHLIAVQGDQALTFFNNLGADVAHIRVLPNWLPPHIHVAHTPPEPVSSVRFIFVGWLTKKKGVKELLNAISFSKSLRNTPITIVGSGDLSEYVRLRVSGESLTNVRCLGWCGSDRVLQEIRASDILVLPTHAEGFPNVILEAMSQGVPVISTPVGAIPEAVINDYSGMLVPPEDSIALQKAMEDLANDINRVKKMGGNCISLVKENYGFEKNCRAVFNVLSECIDGQDN